MTESIMVYKPKQIETHETQLVDVLKNKHFQYGYQMKRNNEPINVDKFRHDINAQWNYERGRQFACLYNGRLIQGRGLAKKAINAFAWAIYRKEII